MDFHKLLQSGNGMSITHKKAFPSDAHAFKSETIKTVFDFAVPPSQPLLICI